MKIHPSIANLVMVVYIIIHRKTSCCYVGQTIRRLKDRIRQHLRGRKQFVDKIIRLEGRDAFEVGVLDVCGSVKELSQRERYWIKYFNCTIPHGFNIDDGSNNSQRKPRCRQIIYLTTGEKFQSLTEASQKLGISEFCIDRVCKGRRTSTHKLKFVFADNLYIEHPIPKNYRRVLCLENGITYDSTSEASRKLNLPRNSIRKVCFGRQENVRGFHFVMVDIPVEERKIFQPKPDSRLRVRRHSSRKIISRRARLKEARYIIGVDRLLEHVLLKNYRGNLCDDVKILAGIAAFYYAVSHGRKFRRR